MKPGNRSWVVTQDTVPIPTPLVQGRIDEGALTDLSFSPGEAFFMPVYFAIAAARGVTCLNGRRLRRGSLCRSMGTGFGLWAA